MGSALASALRSKPHLTVFGRLFANRLNSIPMQNLLINCIETVPVEALEVLADQFHMLGYEGWKFCANEAEKREYLKNSILVHRKKGTVWSLKEICRIAGYPGVYFQEGVGKVYDGELSYDGADTHGSHGWARFIAFVPVPDIDVSPYVVDKLTKIINEYKPARCYLEELVFVLI